MIVDELIAVLGYDLRGEGDLRRFESGLARAEGRAKAFAATLARVGAVAGAAFGAGLAYLGTQVIKTSAQFETYRATLETVEGSAEKAQASLDWITNFAKTTPYEVSEVTESFIRLRAYGLDPMDGTLKAVGDAGSAMGKSIMMGVEAIADATTFQFERLKEFGVTSSVAGDQVTFSWIENGKKVSKSIKKDGEEVGKFLKTNFQRFDGAMDKQSKTFTGMVSNLKDTWSGFLRSIGDAGFFENISNRVRNLLDTLNGFAADGTLNRWATKISGVLTTIVNVIGRVIQRVGEMAAALGGMFNGDAWTGIKIALVAIAALVFPITTAMAAAALAAEDFKTYLEGGESVIGGLIAKVNELWASFGAFNAASINGQAIGEAIGQAIVAGLVAQFTGANSVLHLLADALINLDWSAVGSAWVSAMQIQIGLITGIFKGLGDSIVQILETAFNIDLTGAGIRMVQSLLAGLMTMGDQIRAWFNDLVPPWARDLIGAAVAPGGDHSAAGQAGADIGGMVKPKAAPIPAFGRDRFGPAAGALANFAGNAAKTEPAKVVTSIVNDNRVDSRDQSVHTAVTVNQSVTTAAASVAAAGAVANAVGQAAVAAASRVEQGPAQP